MVRRRAKQWGGAKGGGSNDDGCFGRQGRGVGAGAGVGGSSAIVAKQLVGT